MTACSAAMGRTVERIACQALIAEWAVGRGSDAWIQSRRAAFSERGKETTVGAPVPHGEGVTQSHDQRWEGRGLVGADRGGTCAAGRILRGAGQWPGTGPSKSSAAV